MKQGIKAKDIKDFEMVCQNLNGIIERIAIYKPEARIYVADGSINLVSEFLFDGATGKEEQEKNSWQCGY